MHTQNNETRSVSLGMTKTNSETDNKSFERPELTCCYNIEHAHIFHRTLVAPEMFPRMSEWDFIELNAY